MNKKNTIIILCLLSFVCLASILSCQKESNDNKENYSIDLYGKSPDEIQPYIQGKWKLLSSYGGFINYRDSNILWTFTKDHLVITKNGKITTDIIPTWIYLDISGFTGYVLTGTPVGGVSPNRIHNDSLFMEMNLGDLVASTTISFFKK